MAINSKKQIEDSDNVVHKYIDVLHIANSLLRGTQVRVNPYSDKIFLIKIAIDDRIAEIENEMVALKNAKNFLSHYSDKYKNPGGTDKDE